MAVDCSGCRRGGPAALFFDKDFGLEQEAKVVRAFVGHSGFDGLGALIPRRRVKVQAIPARVKICPAVLALVSDLHLLTDLDLGGAIVAACDQMKSGFHAPRSAFGAGRRFGSLLAFLILVAYLTILSTHSQPLRNSLGVTKMQSGCQN